MKSSALALAALVALCPLSRCLAEKAAELSPILVKPGKVAVEEAFEGTALGKGWTVAKGDWQPRDGMLVGREKKEDKHAAVLTLGRPVRDGMIRFACKLDGGKSMSLSLNSVKGGHLFRVNIAPESVTILKDKDKKNPASKAIALAKADAKFSDGKWHTVQLEIKGAEVAVQTDHGVRLTAGHPELEVGKTGYRFVTGGERLLVDDVKVWDVAP